MRHDYFTIIRSAGRLLNCAVFEHEMPLGEKTQTGSAPRLAQDISSA
jgi:hypothetical protein